ncbi:uncharacterized protein LOC130711181 [Lotus japonicus]|uniref:uncharacterized protein LOC130711181 n=1 Tax=Lotus japonicus TaxID=34305 RepID=UPI002587B3B7|nr:uncharacterized protein LOC130711181 [Lotus japonicus]
MGMVPIGDKEEYPTPMENPQLSDLQLVYHVRDALVAVTLGERENYDDLVGCLFRPLNWTLKKKHLNEDEIALVVTTLNALAGAVSYIDFSHHNALLSAVSSMSLWDYGTNVMDALTELIVSLASTNVKYMDLCLEMLVENFIPPNMKYFLSLRNGLDRKNKVLARVHTALEQIAELVPLAPLRLSKIVLQKMPNVFSGEHMIVMYVENMLRLESGSIGETFGGAMLPALVDRLIQLDVEIGWDGIMQEDAKGIFEMELENAAEFADENEKCDDMSSAELLKRKNLQGNLVVEKLDSLMELTFLHLETCQNNGRLAQVFNILLTSFKRTVLNAYKSKFTQFVMFYACALDPEGCGVKFAMFLAEMFGSDVNPPINRMSAVAYLASYLSRAKFLSAALVASILQRLVDWCFNYCKLHDFDMNPQAHQVFYSGCQAIMYVLCFRMRSLVDIPRLKLQLHNMPMEPIWKHKLSPLKVCLPTVVEEFLRQAKAAQLFMSSSETFVFNDLLESDDLSRSFGGMDRLDMFFPFDPCLLKKSESYIRPHFVRWSRVKTTYDSDDDEDGSEMSDDDFVDRNAEELDMMVSVEGLDFDADLNKMSITPNNNSLKQHMRMPARIRPSTSPESL